MKRLVTAIWGVILVLAGQQAAACAAGESLKLAEAGREARFEVRFFDLNQVRLLEGPFQQAMQRDAQYLLELDPDRLLSRFREYAGLKPKAEIYGGWERLSCSGHSLGHYLSACAMMYAATGDQRFLERANYIVDELARCQQAHGNGYVGAIPEADRIFGDLAAGKIKVSSFGLNGGWVPWYVLHKLFAGLLDAHHYCDNQKARLVVVKLADWACQVTGGLSDEQFQTMLRCEHGGMSEVLAEIYALTGHRKYLELARRFNHRQILDPLVRGEDRLQGLHVNTQIPKLIGAARQYELTGDEQLQAAVKFFWREVTEHRSYVIGGVSDAEHFHRRGELWKHLTTLTAETCATYNMLKLTRHVFAWTADPTCMDYYERALYNHILASQDPKTGMVLYFCSLKPGHFHVYSTPHDSFWCCTGTGMENHARYGESIYARGPHALYVNLFIASELSWPERGLKLRQQTRFPNQPGTRLVFDCQRPLALALRIRHPRWADGKLSVKLNGAGLDTQSTPGGYLTIDRSWQDGDVLEVTFPVSLRLERMENQPKKGAILYGPIVLAGNLGPIGLPEAALYSGNPKANANLPVPEVPVLVVDNKPPSQWVKRISDQQLKFQTVGVGRPEDVELIPFYQAHRIRYTVYWDLLSEQDWQQREAARQAEERRLRELEARTLDKLVPVGSQEQAHRLQGQGSSAGMFRGRNWRHAYPGGWFSYEMKVVPDQPVDLIVTYWGSDVGNRVFDILVDGRKIAEQKLQMERPDEFFDAVYPIPEELTRGKRTITVRFQSHPGAMAGGVFGCRIVLRTPRPE